MRRFAALLGRDLRELARGGVFFVLAGALVLCGFSFYISLPASFFESGSIPPVSMAVINSDDGATGKALFGVLRGLPEIESVVPCDAEEADRLFAAGAVSVVLKIPDDMVDSLIDNRPAEIQVRASDPLEGAAVYSMTVAAADTVNLMQTAVYAYRDTVRPLFSDKTQFRAAYAAFSSDLIKDAILYRRFVDMDDAGPDPYQRQFLSLLVFLLCSGGALCAALLTARQISTGQRRRFLCRGLSFGCYFAEKVLLSLLPALSLCAVLLFLAPNAGLSLAPLRLFTAAALTTAALAPVYLCAAFLLPKPRYAALLNLALMLLFLFAGGGFFPVYLMRAALVAGNPAYLCTRLCAWTLGDGFPALPIGYAALYFAVAALCIAIAHRLWGGGRGLARGRFPAAVIAPPATDPPEGETTDAALGRRSQDTTRDGFFASQTPCKEENRLRLRQPRENILALCPRVYLSHLKPLLRRWPMLLLLLACQILLAYMSAGVLSERQPTLRIALWRGDQSAVAARFLESLESIPALSILETADRAEAEALLENHRALGLAAIDEGLEDRLASKDGAFVSFRPAPGVNAGRVVGKYVAAAAVALQAEQRFQNELAAFGLTAPSLRVGAAHVLSVAYDGPPLLQEALAVTPGYGTPAVFILLIAVYAALTLAGPDRRRIVMRGRSALAMDYGGGFFAVFSVSLLLLAGYFLSGFLLYDAPPDQNAAGAFAALALYAVALGGLAAAAGFRKIFVWLFLPWLLANISLGGALWGAASSNPLLAPLLPVRYALYACAGHTASLYALLALSLLLAALTVTLFCLRAPQRWKGTLA